MEKEKVFNKLTKYFNYDDKVASIAEMVIDGMDSNTFDELVQCVDDELIYYSDQWALIEYYFRPSDEDISLNAAIEKFIDDLSSFLGCE